MIRVLARPAAAVLGLLLVTPLLPVAPASAAPAQQPPASRVLVQLDGGFSPPGLLTTAARSAQKDRIAAVRDRVLARAEAAGARKLRAYEGLPFVALEATPAALRSLRTSGDVVAVQPDEQHQADLSTSVPHVGGTTAWAAGATGSGQRVAVLDTGVETSHPFLSGKVVAEACFAASSTCPDGSKRQIGPGAAAPCTYDAKACPHGTHVAGIVAGRGSTAAGVARDGSLIAIQVFSRTTTGCADGAATCATAWTSDLLAGLDHVATLATAQPVAAVNLSLGGGSYSGACDSSQPALTDAIETLRSLGVATVVSSGNDGNTSQIASPACISSAVAVGSTSLTDEVSDFSNSSTQVALLAPGERILSSYTGGRYAYMYGTSQSAPHVAGAVAVLKHAQPAATPTQLVAALTSAGKPVTDGRNGRTTPRLQVDAALTALNEAMAPAPAEQPAPLEEAAPVEETVTEPISEPAPAEEPVTSEPAPTQPAPSQPAPTEPAPAEPAPDEQPADEPVADTSPVVEPTSTRLSGTDRYDTAAQVFTAAFGCAQGGASSAILARGDGFADALTGSYLAGAEDTGTLLTGTGSVPAATLAALKTSGARTVYLLGGTSAISDAAAAQLKATPSYDCAGSKGANLQVVRIAGTNRFDTARRVAEQPGATAVGTADLTGEALRTAVVASGLGFADALAAGPLSYAKGLPTLLTGPDRLSPEADAALTSLGIEQVLIPGGTAVVSSAVEAALEAKGLQVVRLAGSNRTETAAEIASFAVEELGFPTTGVALARGDAFADALAGAAYAGTKGLPLLLTAGPDALSAATTDYLQSAAGTTSSVTAFGGESAISTDILDEALDHLVV